MSSQSLALAPDTFTVARQRTLPVEPVQAGKVAGVVVRPQQPGVRTAGAEAGELADLRIGRARPYARARSRCTGGVASGTDETVHETNSGIATRDEGR